MLHWIRGRRPSPVDPRDLYGAIVAQARDPALFADGGIPDTLDGRFDSLVLHLFLMLRRLRADGEEGRALGQSLVDLFFTDMDESLREIGVGDLSVGKRVKAMASAFHGRIEAYGRALAEGDAAARAALARNLFGDAPPQPGFIDAVLAYVRSSEAVLAGVPMPELAAGRPRFARLSQEESPAHAQ